MPLPQKWLLIEFLFRIGPIDTAPIATPAGKPGRAVFGLRRYLEIYSISRRTSEGHYQTRDNGSVISHSSSVIRHSWLVSWSVIRHPRSTSNPPLMTRDPVVYADASHVDFYPPADQGHFRDIKIEKLTATNVLFLAAHANSAC